MNIVITGITSLRNRGVEALVVTTVEELCRRRQDLTVNILTRTPDYDKIRLQQHNVEPVQDHLRIIHNSRLRQGLATLSRFHKPLAPGYQAAVRMIREASVVIASGGDVFSSDYGKLGLHLRPLQLALDAGVPIMFLAQSIGPFKTDEETKVWLRVARRSRLVTVREKLTYDYLTKDLGLSTDLVRLAADPAFLLSPSSPTMVANLLSSYGITKDRPVIAIAASQGISRYASIDHDKHLEAWYQVVQMIIDKLDAQVLLIPHVQEINAGNDDRILATNLLRSLDFDPRVRLAGMDHSVSEFKGLIGACDMVISERMHAALAGLSSGVCTVAVGYSVKAKGIMTDLLGTRALRDGLLIPISQFVDTDATCAMIRTVWEQRHEVTSRLNEVLPQVKKDAASNFDMILRMLD